MEITQDELDYYIANVHTLPQDTQGEILKTLKRLEQARARANAHTSFLAFVRRMWPDFVEGYHHKIMAEAFERVARGELKRLIINMAPRHTKSEFASHLFPAWFLGQHPNKFVIQSSNTSDLAVDFGRKVRDTIREKAFTEIFPNCQIHAEVAAAGKWQTTSKGQYFAIGVGGTLTGRGGNLIIIDDPHSEQQAKQAEHKPEIYDDVMEWYTSGPRQRVQPGAAIVIVMTRWSKRDLTGRVIKKAQEDGTIDEWEVIELPAILPSGKPIWPEYWPEKEILAIKDELPIPKWMAQYQQTPTAEEGALVKREWWQRWPHKAPPPVDFIIQSWDTAFEKTQRSDYSACTTWGVFTYEHPETGKKMPNIILLDAYRKRLEFPDLKKQAMDLYKQWEPESLVIEKRASGISLIQELRLMGLPVNEFTPSRGNDKISRVNAISDLFASGVVWAPEHRWADEVIEEFAEFPAGEHDDYVDSSTQALQRYRQGGFVQSLQDEEDDGIPTYPRQRYEYY
jgi:predicted phage terminase large subunit-like protein